MTLIIGIVCDDGVVMAADSAATDFSALTKQPIADKMTRLGNYPIVIGGAGSSGLTQEIREELATYSKTANTVKNVRKDFKALIIPKQRQAVTDFIPGIQSMPNPPSACILAGGFAGSQPFLLEFEQNGETTLYDSSAGNFCAIGSGKVYAHALFRTHLARKRDLRLGKILAYRVLSDSIELAHFGLAHPIHMWAITANSAVLLSDDDKRGLADSIELWRSLESEALGKLLAPPAPEPELPTPDQD